MKALLKVVGIFIGVLVALIVVAIVAVPMFFNPNDYKDQIAALVEKQTGRKLSLTGDIDLSVFPWLGVDIGPLSLSNAAGFGDTPMVQSERTQVRVKLMPLLSKQVEMDTVTLHGLVVNLGKDKSGTSNWDDLIAKSAASAEPKPAEPKPAEPAAAQGAAAPPLAALAIGGLVLKDAQVTWNDAQKGEQYQIKALNLETGSLVPGKPVEIDLSMGLGTGKIGIDSDLTLATVLEYDLDAQRYQLKPLDFGAKLKGKAIPGGAADLKLSTAAIEADLKNQNAAVSGLKLAGLGIDAHGDIKAKDFMGGAPVLDGKLALQVAQVSELLKLLGQEVKGATLGALTADVGFAGTGKKTSIQPFNLKLAVAGEQIPKGKTDIVLSTRGDIDTEAQRFALSDLSVQGLGLDLKGGLQAENLNKEPKFNGAIKLAPINLRAFLTDMGQTLPAMADPKTLNQFALETKLSGTAKSASLSELALNLDDTHLKGNIAVADFAKPAIDFKLAVDGIDVDRYLPPKAAAGKAKDKEAPKVAEKPKAATPSTAAAGAAGDLPVDTLRALDVRGNLTVGKLKINNANLSNLNLTISAKNGDVKLSPLAANLYGGKYHGGVLIDARGKSPKLTLDENLSGIQIDPLLTDLAGDSKLSGTLDLQAQLNAAGANADSLKRSLSGPAKITMRDGALKGVNLGMLARKAQAGVVMPVEEKVQTDFTEMTATLNFAQGVMSNEDLSMKSPLLRVEGAGKVNLVSEQIDYVLKTTLSATSKGQGGKETGELEGLTVPVKVSGTFAEPRYLPDLEGLARAKAEKLLEKESQKATEKLQEKLGDETGKEVGDQLKGILKF